MVTIRANKALYNRDEYGVVVKGQVFEVTEQQLVRMRELEMAGSIERVHRRPVGEVVTRKIKDFKALVGYENKSAEPADAGKRGGK